MPSVMLSDQEWQALLNILGNAPAPLVVTYPLVMKINQQLQARPATAMKGEEREADEANRMPSHMNG